MSAQYWFMLPISIVVATIAMASGVEGATFFSPIFMLALGLPPHVAIGTGLITETFGFATGLYAYARKKLIDYRLGAYVSSRIPQHVLERSMGVLFALVGLVTLLEVVLRGSG